MSNLSQATDTHWVWKKIDQWYPLQYRYDGDEVPFQITAHGNQKPGDGKPYVSTKTSTKRKAMENLEGKDGPKRALFRTVKNVGGVLGVDNLGTLPRNERQIKYLKEKNVEARDSKPSRDPLAIVIELQKAVLPGFIWDVVCNDLPTVIAELQHEARQRSTMGKKNWWPIKPRKFGYDVSVRASVRTSVQTRGRGRGVLRYFSRAPIRETKERHLSLAVFCL